MFVCFVFRVCPPALLFALSLSLSLSRPAKRPPTPKNIHKKTLCCPLNPVALNITPLGELSLRNNSLASTLPPWLFALPVFTIDLSHNLGLAGTLPTWLGHNPWIREINLDDCAVTGRVADSFDRCVVCVVCVLLCVSGMYSARRTIIGVLTVPPPPASLPPTHTQTTHTTTTTITTQPQPQPAHRAEEPAVRRESLLLVVPYLCSFFEAFIFLRAPCFSNSSNPTHTHTHKTHAKHTQNRAAAAVARALRPHQRPGAERQRADRYGAAVKGRAVV